MYRCKTIHTLSCCKQQTSLHFGGTLFDRLFSCDQDVLKGLGEVRDLEERSLTGTWNITSLQRWRWKTADTSGESEEWSKRDRKEIRLFLFN